MISAFQFSALLALAGAPLRATYGRLSRSARFSFFYLNTLPPLVALGARFDDEDRDEGGTHGPGGEGGGEGGSNQ